MKTEEDIVEQLEKIVDAAELGHVLSGLVLMCYEKAAHLRSNWQDEKAAKVWERAAKHIEPTATKILDLSI